MIVADERLARYDIISNGRERCFSGSSSVDVYNLYSSDSTYKVI